MDHEGDCKKLEGGSWDVASGLPRKLSVRGTKQGAIQISSASVLLPLQPGLPHLSRASGSGSALQYPLILRIHYINHGKDITNQILYSIEKQSYYTNVPST